MKDLIERAQKFYSGVTGTAGAVTENEKQAFAIIRDFIAEYDMKQLDFATDEFFRKHGGFDVQVKLDFIFDFHTTTSYRIFSASNSHQIVTLTSADGETGFVDFYAAAGTPRRLIGHDFFMAAIEGRLDKNSQEFLSSWLGAHFEDDGTLSFDEELYAEENDETSLEFWKDMKETCSKYDYDKNCFISS